MIGWRFWGQSKSHPVGLPWRAGVVMSTFSLDGIDLVVLDEKLNQPLGKRLTLDF